MQMKGICRIGLLFAVLAFASGCAVMRIREVAVMDAGIKYVVPTSPRSMDGVLLLEIDNPSVNFQIDGVDGCVRDGEKVIARFQGGQIQVDARSRRQYELPCTVRLEEGVSLLDVLAIIARGSLASLRADADVHASLQKPRIGKTLEYRDVSLSQFSK